jgi:hypothetical protein
MPSAAGGRWDDGMFDVLYTSKAADGAAAEAYFHLSRGQPVFRSKVKHRLYQLRATIKKALALAELSAVARLGVDTARYGALSDNERHKNIPGPKKLGKPPIF